MFTARYGMVLWIKQSALRIYRVKTLRCLLSTKLSDSSPITSALTSCQDDLVKVCEDVSVGAALSTLRLR